MSEFRPDLEQWQQRISDGENLWPSEQEWLIAEVRRLTEIAKDHAICDGALLGAWATIKEQREKIDSLMRDKAPQPKRARWALGCRHGQPNTGRCPECDP